MCVGAGSGKGSGVPTLSPCVSVRVVGTVRVYRQWFLVYLCRLWERFACTDSGSLGVCTGVWERFACTDSSSLCVYTGVWERFAWTDTVPLCVCTGVWKTFRKSCPSASNTSVRTLDAPRVPFSATGSFTQHVKRCRSATVVLHVCQSERLHSKSFSFKKKCLCPLYINM